RFFLPIASLPNPSSSRPGLIAQSAKLTALHAPLPPPLRPSPASHLRRPRRPWTHGRPHPQPSHCRNRRSSPRQALERRPLHPPPSRRTLRHNCSIPPHRPPPSRTLAPPSPR